MRYCLNLSRIGLLEYRDLLKAQNLLPGRRMLLDDIDRNFAALLALGIETLEQLRQRLATPPKLAALSAASGISEGYLKLLKRESGSFEQAPVPLASFPGQDAALLASLRQDDSINSRDYFERGADQTGELYHLCDLVRINGVGALAAKAFYDAGFTSVQEVANAEAADMLRRVTRVNAEQQCYKANLGEKDMRFCIDFARLFMRYSD